MFQNILMALAGIAWMVALAWAGYRWLTKDIARGVKESFTSR